MKRKYLWLILVMFILSTGLVGCTGSSSSAQKANPLIPLESTAASPPLPFEVTSNLTNGNTSKPIYVVEVSYQSPVLVNHPTQITFYPPAPFSLVGVPGYLFAANTELLTNPFQLTDEDFPDKFNNFTLTLTANSFDYTPDFTGKATAFFVWEIDENILVTPLLQVIVNEDSSIPPVEVAVPLIIQEVLPNNATGFARVDEMATFGMPFPKGQVAESNGRPALAVNGAPVYQFTTIEKWPGDNTVKWAKIDVQSDVPAGGKVEDLFITNGSGTSGQANLAQVVGDLIKISTGPLQVDIRKTGFNFVDRVVVDGLEIVQSGASAGTFGLDTSGLALKPSADTQVIIEENGPARAVIRAKGTLVNTLGKAIIDFTCRMTARAGSRALEVTFTVRNANINRPQHTLVESIELSVRANLGSGAKTATLAKPAGSQQIISLLTNDQAYTYQAYSGANTYDVDGDGPGYKPHIPKVVTDGPDEPGEQGYRIVKNGSVIFSTPDKDTYPNPNYLDLTGSGGITIAIRDMPYLWPATLAAQGDGTVTAGIFTRENAVPYTFVWRQHESRTAIFSFHTGSAVAPDKIARSLDFPISARAKFYSHYQQSKTFHYDLATTSEQNAAYTAMGINHAVSIPNDSRSVCRFQPAHGTGGFNNHDSVEKGIGVWLRHGHGGDFLNSLDRALYLSEWQILRSDNFLDKNDPGANNDEIPHSTAFEGDLEHRYRDGVILAYHLTGDTRYQEALFDEAEILSYVDITPQERSMYQSHRALALVGEFTGDESLRARLKEYINFHASQTLDIKSGVDGWGWQTPTSDLGDRRYYANSSQNKTEKGPGENYVTHGFIPASLGPLGFYHAARYLGLSAPEGTKIRGRMRDLSFWTKNELFPFDANPENRSLVYSYGLKTQSVYSTACCFDHEILMGMSETFKDTCDLSYLQRGVQFIEAAVAQDKDVEEIDARFPAQHFMKTYLDYLGGKICAD